MSRKIEFNATAALTAILDGWRDKMGEYEWRENVRSVMRRVKEFEALVRQARRRPDFIYSIYREVDFEVGEAIARSSNTPSCGKGCTACCHLQVELSQEEVEPLAQLVEDGKVPLDYALLEDQASVKRDNLEWIKLPLRRNACVFLDQETKACRVYDVRPVACRKLYVSTPPANCGWDYLTKRARRNTMIGVLEAEIIMTAMGTQLKTGSLPHLLKKRLDAGRKETPRAD